MPSAFPPTPTPYVQTASGWMGWVLFAGSMFALLGFFHLIKGFAALFNDAFFVVGPEGLPLNIDYTVFGWIHLVGGVVLISIAIGVFAAKRWARVAGIITAAVFAIVDFVDLNSFPVWSLTTIAIQVFVIYTLAVHGAEIKKLGQPF